LEARIQSVYKRGKNISWDIFSYNDLEINLKNRVFLRAWEEVNITGKEFQIIEILISNRGTTISRTEIIEDIWGEEWLFNSDGKLDVYISNLRTKLWKDLIKTIKWYGYRI
jgi:DNA-binding response OmpR family regulator